MFGFERWWVLVLMLVFWGGLIALVVWGARHFLASDKRGSALKILNERFARGEIDQQEYEQRKAALLRR